MVKVVIKDNHLNFNGVKYFRGNAEEVSVGAYGEKVSSVFTMNRLDVKGRIPTAKITNVRSTMVDVDMTQTTRSAFNTKLWAIIKGVPVELSADTAFGKIKDQELKLVKFSVDHNHMKNAINDSPAALKNLIDYGNDARIALQIFVAMEATFATQFDNNVAVALSAGQEGIVQASVQGNHGTSGETVVELTTPTTFAYLLAKPDWDAKQKKNKTKVTDLDTDEWGP